MIKFKAALQNGFYLGQIKDIPIYIHWSAPFGAMCISGLKFLPLMWLAYLLLILIHELGHAAALKYCRYQVTKVTMDGLGGKCHWIGSATWKETLLISSGGILAQLVVLAVGIAYMIIMSPIPLSSDYLLQVLNVATLINILLIAFNLLPIQTLDGDTIWPLLIRLIKSKIGKYKTKESKISPTYLQGVKAEKAAKAYLNEIKEKIRKERSEVK